MFVVLCECLLHTIIVLLSSSGRERLLLGLEDGLCIVELLKDSEFFHEINQ